MLQYAGVHQYCAVQRDRCLVYIDNRGWPILQPGPQRVRHGTYLRVIVPPAEDGTHNTLQAIRYVETYAANFLQQASPPASSPAPAPVTNPVPPAPPPWPTFTTPHQQQVWINELEEAFLEHSHIECEEEGKVLYAAGWFINNANYRKCPVPQMTKLMADSHSWFEEVMQLWAHQFQPDAPVRIHVVQPYPPAASHRAFAIHLLIEQNLMEGKAANIVSFHVQGHLQDQLWQSALSLPRWVATEDLIDATELNFLCETRRCTAVCGRMHFQRFIREEIASGMSIEIFSQPPRECDVDPTASSSTRPHVPRTIHAVSGNALIQTSTRSSTTYSGFVDRVLSATAKVTDDVIDDHLLQQCLEAEDLQHDAAALIQLHLSKTTSVLQAIEVQVLSAIEEPFLHHIEVQNQDQSFQRQLSLQTTTLRLLHHWACTLEACDVPSHPAQNIGETHRRTPMPSRPKVTVSLEATLPRGEGRIYADNLFMHSATANWQQQLFDAELKLQFLPEGLHLHPTTYDAMCAPWLYRDSQFAGQAVIFIDGAAWSLLCVRFDDQGQPALNGCAAGPVVTASEHPLWSGATVADNLAAEFTAFLHAAVLGAIVEFDAPVVIAPDLALSALLAEDLCTCSAHPRLVQLMHGLGSFFRQRGGCVREVRAHRGNPWNELADRLAKFALTGSAVGHLRIPVLRELLLNGDEFWTWLQQQHSAFEACMPPSPAPGLWHLSPPATKFQPEAAAVETKQQASISFSAVTANVLALDPVDEGQQVLRSSRAARLDLQWHQNKIAVAGLQETRRPAGRSFLDHYVTFASGAFVTPTCPHHGCELWLHRDLPWLTYPTGETLTFGQMTPAVAHADARRLIINLQKDDIQVSFVVLHAPCRSTAPDGSLDGIRKWWKETTTIVEKARLAPLTWVFADLNADIGTSPTVHFDCFGHGGDTEQAKIAEEALQQLAWFAPSTFRWCHCGPHSTWRHPRGTEHRLDFPLCSKMAFELVESTQVMRSHDSCFAHEDHTPVTLRCGGWLSLPTVRSTPRWDFEAMANPAVCKAFQDALMTLPIPAWSVDIDTHVELWERNLLQLAQQFFCKTTKTKARPRLQEATCNLIAFKRSVLDFGRACGVLHEPDIRAHLKAIEKEIHQRVREDQQAFYDELVQQLAAQGDLNNYKFVFKLRTRLGGRPGHKHAGGKALPLLQPPGSEPLKTFEDQQQYWLRQFAAVEAGHIMSRDSLQTLHHGGLGIDPAILDKQAIPTLYDIQTQIRKLKRGRAPGSGYHQGCFERH